MSITSDIIQARDLSARDRQAWLEIKRANAAYYSPYFHPDYARLVSVARGQGHVLRIMKNGQVHGFLAFDGKRCVRPAGAPMTDYHGIVAAPDIPFDVRSILKSAGISTFQYDGLIDPGNHFGADMNVESATVVDLKVGAESWRKARDSSYRRKQKSNRRRFRKAGEEVGEPRLETYASDAAVYTALMDWKHRQFHLTGKYDVLSVDWTQKLLAELWTQSRDGLHGALHALWFGDVLAAAEYGMVEDGVYHSWIVSYNPDMHPYAPGFLLLENLISDAESLGYHTLDLGAGQHEYKKYYDDKPVHVKQGFVAAAGAPAIARKAYNGLEKLTDRLPLGPLSSAPAKLRRRYAQIAACESAFGKRVSAMAAAFKPAPST